MALIKCPECGREISNAAAACPHCGFPIENGGNVAKADIANNKRIQTRTIIISIAVAVALIAGVLTANYASNISARNRAEQERQEYIQKLTTIRENMLATGVEAESTAYLVRKVWRNTIEKNNDRETNRYTAKGASADKVYLFKNDFNDSFATSLDTLFHSEEYESSIEKIKTGKETIENDFRTMQNPPEDLKACWEELDKLYDNFATLCECAMKPDGSLLTYSEVLSSADSEFMEHYKKLGAIIPEE